MYSLILNPLKSSIMDFYTSEGKLNMVAYLLADTNSLSVRFAKYAGTDKCDLLETQEFGYCSLLKAMDKLWDKIDVENRTMARVTNQLRREEKRLVDYTALREAFVNAFVHNDYTTEQAPVVEMFSDRLTITSYGGLVSDLTQEEFFNGRSIPRNRELMRIFHDMEWVEQLGSGIHRILRRYSKDIYEISEHFVVVTFKFAESLTDTSNVSQNVSQRTLTERQSLIRQRIIENNTISARSIAEELGVNIRTIYRELKQLNIHWIGSPKSGHWEFI